MQRLIYCLCGDDKVLALVFCATCYTLKRQDEEYFGGLREAVLEREWLPLPRLRRFRSRQTIRQPRWAYMMMWSGSSEGSDSPSQLQAILHAHQVSDRGDSRLSPPLPGAGLTVRPVDAEARKDAQALVSRFTSPSLSGGMVSLVTSMPARSAQILSSWITRAVPLS